MKKIDVTSPSFTLSSIVTISFFIPFAASTAAGRRIKETKRGRGTHSWKGREGGGVYLLYD